MVRGLLQHSYMDMHISMHALSLRSGEGNPTTIFEEKMQSSMTVGSLYSSWKARLLAD